jgi:hypothetical protein
MVDYQKLDELVRSFEAEMKTRDTRHTILPVRSLRLKDEAPFGKVIAWSYDKPNLDSAVARRLIDAHLAEAGLRTGVTNWSTDDDGTPMAFWGVEVLPAPPAVSDDVGALETGPDSTPGKDAE